MPVDRLANTPSHSSRHRPGSSSHRTLSTMTNSRPASSLATVGFHISGGGTGGSLGDEGGSTHRSSTGSGERPVVTFVEDHGFDPPSTDTHPLPPQLIPLVHPLKTVLSPVGGMGVGEGVASQSKSYQVDVSSPMTQPCSWSPGAGGSKGGFALSPKVAKIKHKVQSDVHFGNSLGHSGINGSTVEIMGSVDEGRWMMGEGSGMGKFNAGEGGEGGSDNGVVPFNASDPVNGNTYGLGGPPTTGGYFCPTACTGQNGLVYISYAIYNCTATAGQYCPGSGVTSLCGAGTYSSSAGMLTCSSCGAGLYGTGTGMSTCLTCAAGTFSWMSISSFCTNCSAGTYSTGSGFTAVSNCSGCSTGAYGSGTGVTVCSSCAAGTYTSSTGNVLCTSCSAGFVSNSTGVTSTSGCIACVTGKFAPSPGGTVCSTCPSG